MAMASKTTSGTKTISKTTSGTKTICTCSIKMLALLPSLKSHLVLYYSMFVLRWYLGKPFKKPYTIKVLNKLVLTQSFITLHTFHCRVIIIVMASTAQNPCGKKHFNSQAKYLIMKLWEYFEQEAKKSRVAVNVKNKVSKAFGMDSLASMRY